MKYFLLHDFIYGWDVSHFEETEDGERIVFLMDTIEEAKEELKDIEEDKDLWKIERGYLSKLGDKIITEDGTEFNLIQE